MKKKTTASGTRTMAVKLKTARGRKISSQLWLQRQLNDPYVQKAQALGYRSRAAFKLMEIDEKYHLLSPGKHVVDLGAAPGGWVQVAVAKTGSLPEHETVIGIDLKAIDPIPGAVLIEGDFLDPEMPDRLKALLKGPVDLVMSDMAASSSGHAPTDHLRIMMLAEVGFEFAREVLKPGGAYVAKVLQGGAESDLLRALKRNFTKVAHVKPPASRADSAEMYVVALGFKKND